MADETLSYDALMEQRYGNLTPVGMIVNVYAKLSVTFLPPAEDAIKTVAGIRLHKYFMVPSDEASEKYAEYSKRKEEWFDNIKSGLKRTTGEKYSKAEREQLQWAYSGKGFPEDYELALGFAAGTGQCAPDHAAIQAHCDQHFGIDCSGFVNAYLLRKNRLPRSCARSIGSYERSGKRRNAVAEIRPEDLLVWADENGALKHGSGGHIAIVQSPFPGSDIVLVAESAGGIGLCYSNYKVLEVKKCGPNGTVFRVERPLRKGTVDGKAWVRIVGASI
jgi:hypothetical protein